MNRVIILVLVLELICFVTILPDPFTCDQEKQCVWTDRYGGTHIH